MADSSGTVIVGGGPSGLLLAHLILAQPHPPPQLLPVRIFESRADPCIPLPMYKTRQYCIGLSARGRDAVSKVEGLWEVMQDGGVPTSQFIIHVGSKSIQLKRNPDKPSLLINQRTLAALLVSELKNRHAEEKVKFKHYVEKYMPPLKVSLEAAEAFIEQRPTSSMRVKCSRYFDARGHAVLIGDAAHAMSNALGQGCNSSLQDVCVLSQFLAHEPDMLVALEKYSKQRVMEDHAATYLSENAFPQASWLLPLFFIGNLSSALLAKVFPPSVLKPPIQSLCSETLTPYSEIVQMHQTWLSFVEFTNRLAKVSGPSS